MSYKLKKMKKKSTRNKQHLCFKGGESDESDTELLEYSGPEQSAVNMSGQDKTSSPSEDSIHHDITYWRKIAADEMKSARQTKLKQLSGTHTTICIDISDSMNQNNAWEQTKTFFKDYMDGMKEEFAIKNKFHHTALVTFGNATVTKVHHRLTQNLEALEHKLVNITPGGPSPLLAGLILAKASATVSNHRFGSVNKIYVPPKIIVVTDGKATDVNEENELNDQHQNENAQKVKQLIIDEIRSMKEKEDIDIDFVYVGNPDIVFLHHLRGISGGELMPHTSGRFFAKNIAIKCMFKEDGLLEMPEHVKRKVCHEVDGTLGDNESGGQPVGNEAEGHHADHEADSLRALIQKKSVQSEDKKQRDIPYWRKIAADELKSAKQTQLKQLTGTHTTICIDVSDSMRQNNAWEQTKTFFKDYMSGMREEFAKKEENHNTALVTFGHATKVHHRLTKDLNALERLIENITPGGPSPLLAGLILAKASATVSNCKLTHIDRFRGSDGIYIPPRIIVVTDGKATNVDEVREHYDQDQNKSANKVKQLIIKEIRSMKEEEDIDIDFVYVGNPDIVFLHELRGISGGELRPHTSGRSFSKYTTIQSILQKSQRQMTYLLKPKFVSNETEGSLVDNEAESHHGDTKAEDLFVEDEAGALGNLIHREKVPSEDAFQQDMTNWRKIAADELKNARQTELKKLFGTHTTICIDVSDSMKQNNAWEQTKTFFKDYIDGMKEEFAKKNKYHNTALVTFGRVTKVHQRLTKDLEALESIIENITPGGTSPLLAGLLLAKAAVTVSNYRFGNVNDMYVPPKVIVVTDGKATDVREENKNYDQDQNEIAQKVKQLIIDEIRSMKEEEDIDIDFVYVGNPDIVFLHHLQGISGGELMPHTSGRFFAKYIAIKCMCKEDEKDKVDQLKQKHEEEGTLVDNEAAGHPVDNDTKGPLADNDTESQPVDNDTKGPLADNDTESQPVDNETEVSLDDNDTESQSVDNETEGPLVDNDTESQPVDNETEGPLVDNDTESQPVDKIQRDISYWRKMAADELKSAKQTKLKYLMGSHTTICIDVSDSMRQNNAWEQTQTFFTKYVSGIRDDTANGFDNTALVTFGHVTKVHHRLTTDHKALERTMENMTLGGPSPLLAGLILAKASATVSCYRFAGLKYMDVPPKIIVVTDGKATDVNEVNELYEQDQNLSAHKVKQLIIDEIRSMTEEEDIHIDFVYVGNPDIVFLHELREISGGELKPYTSGRFLANYINIQCMFKRDEENILNQVDESNSDESDTEQPRQSFVSMRQMLQKQQLTSNGLDTDKTEITAAIDKLFHAKSEETVSSVFDDLMYKIPNVNKLYMKMSGRTLLNRAVDDNLIIVAEQFLYYGDKTITCDSSKEKSLQIAIAKKYDEMAALIVSTFPNFVVRRMFGDSKSKPGPLEEGLTKQNTKKNRKDNNGTDEPKFILKDLITNGLDKTFLQVLDSFIEKQEDGSYKVHVKLLDTDDKGREPNKKDQKTGFNERKSNKKDQDTGGNERESKKDDVGKNDKEKNLIDNEFNPKDLTTFQNLASSKKRDAINHPAVRVYMEHNWKKWCQNRFLLYGCLYLFSLFCLTYSAVTGVTAPDVHTYDTPLQYSRAVMEVISYLYAISVLFTEIRQMLRHQGDYFKGFFNFMEFLSSILILCVLPLRYTQLRAHWYVFALGYFLWAIRIFKYATVFRQAGVYVEVIKKILVEDFVQFSILFLVINTIFSGTFLLVLKADDSLYTHIDTSSFQSILYVGVRTLIEAAPIVDYTGLDGYRETGTVCMLVYMFFTIVVMLNILIAQFNETYSKTYGECIKTVRAHRADIIARAQRNEWHPLLKHRSWLNNYESVLKVIDKKRIEKDSLNLDAVSKPNDSLRKKQIKIGLDVRTVKKRLQSMESNINKLVKKPDENTAD